VTATGRTITALKVQKKNHQRVNVYLDGEFAFGLQRIVAAWLNIGQVLSEDKIAQLRADDGREKAYQRALRFLEVRPRSSNELRQHLSQAGIEEEVVDEVLERLRKASLVDDTRFAEAWIENRSEFRPRGRRALAFELRQRGVDAQTIQETLEELDEETLAYQAAAKQARRLEGLEWPEFRQKMTGFLARRGFNYETSQSAVRRVWSERTADLSNNEKDDFVD
jgi:regulatory protein